MCLAPKPSTRPGLSARYALPDISPVFCLLRIVITTAFVFVMQGFQRPTDQSFTVQVSRNLRTIEVVGATDCTRT